MAAGWRTIAWALGLCLCTALGAGAETVVFQDRGAPPAAYAGTRDAILKNGTPTLNFGGVPRLRVTTTDIGTNLQTWTVLSWDISAHIPPGAVVTAVTITLDVEATETGASCDIYALKRAWVEGGGLAFPGATWNTTNGTTPWGTAGAENTTSDRGTAILGTIPGNTAGPKNVALSAAGVALVQGWVDDPAVNFGVIIRSGSADATDYGSRETGTATRRPKLTVTFTAPSDLTTVTFRDGVAPTATYSGTLDTFINSNGVTQNNGAATTFQADGNGITRGLVRWDPTAGFIPTDATVTAAQLTLDVTTNGGGTYELYEVKRNWTEAANWNTFAPSSSWGTLGGDAGTDRGTTVLGTVPNATGSQTVTLGAAGLAVVQGWIANPASAFGVLVRPTAGSNNTLTVTSSEGAAALRPGLTVTYQSGQVKVISGGSAWSSPGAWTPPGLPTSKDHVVVSGSGVVTFAIPGTTTVRRIVTSGAGLSVTAGTLQATELVWLSAGDLVVSTGATFVSTGTTDVLAGARLDLQGGSLRLGTQTCWVGGTLRALNGRIEPNGGGSTDVEVRGALDLDGPTVRGGGAEGLHVFRTATVARLRRARFEAIAGGASSVFLSVDADGPVAISAPGCYFEAVSSGKNVRLTDTSVVAGGGAAEDVVLNLEDRGTATNGPGVGPANEVEVNGASINWVWAAPDTTSGTAVGFPQVAYDLTTFAEYSMYAAFRDVDPTGTDRIQVFDPAGSGVDQGTWFDVPAAQGDIVGYPWWDQVAGNRVLWVVTTTGRLYRFRDPGPNAGSVAPDAGFPKVVLDAGQPVVFTTPPITSDSLTVWVGGTRLGAPRVFAFAAATGNTAWTLATGLPDPITSEFATEMLHGNTRLFAGGGSVLAGGGTVILNQPFTTNPGAAFPYVDDTFRGTNNPTEATGAWANNVGRTTGGVRVDLGDTSVSMSGGFRTTFTVPGTSSIPIRFTLSYREVIDSEFEFDEFAELLVAVDSELIGSSGTVDYVTRFFGDGNGGADMDTGWQTFTFQRQLAPGSHTLTLGGFLNKSTQAEEHAFFSFDDVNIQTSPTQGRIYRVNTPTQLVDAQCTTPFAPVVAAPFAAYLTGLFVGDTAGRMHGVDPATMAELPGWPVQGGTASILGSVWLDYTGGQVFWGDEGGVTHGRRVNGTSLPGFPLANPLGLNEAVRNVTSGGGLLWVAGEEGRLRAFDISTALASGQLYRFGAQAPVGPIATDSSGRPAIQTGGKLLVLAAQTDPTP